jgi:membrane-bound ClpP family serine protease
MNVVRRNSGQWLFGLIILVIGIIFLLENLFGMEMWKNVWLFWPILLIIWGLMQLLQGRSIFFSIILLIIGILFLLKNFQLYQWPDIIWKYWPLIIIAVGIDQLIKRPESYSSQSNQSFRKEKKKILTQDDEII